MALSLIFKEKIDKLDKRRKRMATKTETITIKVSPEEKELIKIMATEKDITVSKLLYNMLFKEYLKEVK